jgi:ATP-binding cassette, subfamily B, bacterial
VTVPASLRARKLTLLISHRLNALRDADRIVVLRDGRIVEAGSHDDLLDRAGHYAELFRLQASGYQEAGPAGQAAPT